MPLVRSLWGQGRRWMRQKERPEVWGRVLEQSKTTCARYGGMDGGRSLEVLGMPRAGWAGVGSAARG